MTVSILRTLSVLIVTWQARARLEECLGSVNRAALDRPKEIIVVDNGSTDGTADLIAKRFPNFRLVRNAANRGFAAANNQAFASARGDYILLLNDDVVIKTDTLTTLVRWLDHHPQAGGVTCPFRNPDGSPQSGYQRQLPTLGRMIASFFHHYLHLTTPTAKRFLGIGQAFGQQKIIEQPAATCLLLRRSAIERAGGLFDERFPIFFNDADLAHRLNTISLSVWLTPDTTITHRRAQSTERLDPYWAKQEFYRSLFLYWQKTGRRADLWFGRIFFTVFLGLLYLLTSLTLLSRYFETPITDRRQSLARQAHVIRALWQPFDTLPQPS